MKPILETEDLLKFYKSKFWGNKAIRPHRKWFPIFATPPLAGIVADLMGDGHLQGEPKWRIDYTSKRKQELQRFGNEVYRLFSVRGKIRPCNGNKWGTSFNYGVNCKPLARTFCLLGVPTGSKIKKKFLIPEWILNDKECFRVFVRRLFDCEGCVSVEGSSSFINLEMWKAESFVNDGIEFFKQIKNYLKKHFDIQTTNIFLNGVVNVRKDGLKVRGIRLRIKRFKSLINFYKEIGFDNKEKQNKLKEVLMIKGWDG